MNCWEISRSSSIKIRSHQGATNKDLTDYVKKKKKKKLQINAPMKLQVKLTPCRKLEK